MGKIGLDRVAAESAVILGDDRVGRESMTSSAVFNVCVSYQEAGPAFFMVCSHLFRKETPEGNKQEKKCLNHGQAYWSSLRAKADQGGLAAGARQQATQTPVSGGLALGSNRGLEMIDLPRADNHIIRIIAYVDF
jgi:hypothetical protein